MNNIQNNMNSNIDSNIDNNMNNIQNNIKNNMNSNIDNNIDNIFISYFIEKDIESKNFININSNNKNIFKILPLISSIKIKINDIQVIFHRKNINNGNTSLYFIDLNYKYFMKIPYMYIENDLLKREIFILKKLNQYDYFPKIVFYNNILLITEYIGDIIKKETIPNDILFQINDINNILSKEKIIHSDIKQSEMLIKENKLYIVDFGWSKFNNKWSCDNNFCNKTKPNLDNTTDIQKMINVIIKLLN
jgi:predicted Ser/Thr protein kinase